MLIPHPAARRWDPYGSTPIHPDHGKRSEVETKSASHVKRRGPVMKLARLRGMAVKAVCRSVFETSVHLGYSADDGDVALVRQLLNFVEPGTRVQRYWRVVRVGFKIV